MDVKAYTPKDKKGYTPEEIEGTRRELLRYHLIYGCLTRGFCAEHWEEARQRYLLAKLESALG